MKLPQFSVLAALVLAAAASAAAPCRYQANGFSFTVEPIGEAGPVALAAGKCSWLVVLHDVEGAFECTVKNPDGDIVAGPFVTDRIPVPRPEVWTDEKPVCYTLAVKRGDSVVEKPFGFRTIEIASRRLVVNGRPVRVRFAPKELNGNADFAARLNEDDALRRGMYALTGRQAASIVHEAGSDNFGATRHAFQNWSVAATNYFERLVVENRNVFVDSSCVALEWKLLRDGVEADSGEIDLHGLGPGDVALYDMPDEVAAARYREGTLSVRFEFRSGGEVVASDQIDVVDSRDSAPLSAGGGWFAPSAVGFEKTAEGAYSFSTDGTVFTYGCDTLLPLRFERRGLFGRSPLVASGSISPSFESAKVIVSPLSAVDERDGALVFTASSVVRHGTGLETSIPVTQEWRVYPNGTVACSAKLRMNGARRLGFAFELPYTPPSTWYRLGWSMPVPGEDLDIEWFGLGPWSTTPSDTEGAFLGRWRANASAPLKAEKVRGVRVGGLTVRTLGAPFAFSLAPKAPAGDDATSPFVLSILGDADAEGAVELAFTLSAGDAALTARTPDWSATVRSP